MNMTPLRWIAALCAGAITIASCANDGTEQDELLEPDQTEEEQSEEPLRYEANIESEDQGQSASALAAESCSALRTSRLTIRGDSQFDLITTYISESGQFTTHRFHMRGPTDLGSTAIDFDMCRGADRVWRIRRAFLDVRHADLNLTVNDGRITAIAPRLPNFGNAIVVTRVEAGAIIAVPIICDREPRPNSYWNSIRGLTSLPLPIPFWWDVGVWIGSAFLPDAPPDTYWCNVVGTASNGRRLPFAINQSDGSVRWTASATSYTAVTSRSFTEPCSQDRYCGTTYQFSVRTQLR